MTAAEFRHPRARGETVSFNPFLLFVLLLITPYLLFFSLLMLVTGELNLSLLAESVWQGEWSVYMKTWVIGSFVLSVLGALFFGGYRTERYLTRHRAVRRTRPRPAPHEHHYVIEAVPEPVDATRYADLDDAMVSLKQ